MEHPHQNLTIAPWKCLGFQCQVSRVSHGRAAPSQSIHPTVPNGTCLRKSIKTEHILAAYNGGSQSCIWHSLCRCLDIYNQTEFSFFFFLCIIHIWLIFFFQKVFTISLIPHSQEALSPPMLSLNPTTIPCIYPRFIFHTSAQLLTTETTFWDSLQLATPLLPWTKLPQLI